MTETLGKYLVSCRQKQGLTVEEIAQRTRINPRMIKFAEEDRFDKLPGPVFIKGLMRSYAKVTGVSGDELVERYEALGLVEADKSPELINMPLSDEGVSGGYALIGAAAALAVILSIGYYFNVFNLIKDSGGKKVATVPAPKPPEPAAGVEKRATPQEAAPEERAPEKEPTADAGPEQTAALAEPEPEGAQRPETGEAAPEETGPEPAAVSAPAGESPKERPEATPGPAAGTHGPLELKFMALSDTWIKVYIDDATEKEIILREGNNVTWRAEKGFRVSIGNVAGTRIFFNGQEVELEQPVSNVLTNLRFPKSPSAQQQTTEQTR